MKEEEEDLERLEEEVKAREAAQAQAMEAQGYVSDIEGVPEADITEASDLAQSSEA